MATNPTIIYSNRKTISIEVKMDEIIVRAPKQMSPGEVRAFLIEKQDWVRKHVRKMEEQKQVYEKLQPFTNEELDELKKKAFVLISKKVKKYAAMIGVDYGRITIRSQRSRWGSCSVKGNLSFNCLLMLFPEEVIDYVVVHELCHRKYMNHSADFYKEVVQIFPEYKRSKKWLKEHGGKYIIRLP